jgi:hypothetical protein
VHDAVHHVARAARAAEQVADQLGRRDEAAAVVAQVDDEVLDALRAETVERRAQLAVGGRDVGTKVDVADTGRAGQRQHAHAAVGGDGVDRDRALDHRHFARRVALAQPQAALHAILGRPEHVADRVPRRQQLGHRYESVSRVDLDDLVAARHRGLAGRARREHLGD